VHEEEALIGFLVLKKELLGDAKEWGALQSQKRVLAVPKPSVTRLDSIGGGGAWDRATTPSKNKSRKISKDEKKGKTGQFKPSKDGEAAAAEDSLAKDYLAGIVFELVHAGDAVQHVLGVLEGYRAHPHYRECLAKLIQASLAAPLDSADLMLLTGVLSSVDEVPLDVVLHEDVTTLDFSSGLPQAPFTLQSPTTGGSRPSTSKRSSRESSRSQKSQRRKTGKSGRVTHEAEDAEVKAVQQFAHTQPTAQELLWVAYLELLKGVVTSRWIRFNTKTAFSELVGRPMPKSVVAQTSAADTCRQQPTSLGLEWQLSSFQEMAPARRVYREIMQHQNNMFSLQLSQMPSMMEEINEEDPQPTSGALSGKGAKSGRKHNKFDRAKAKGSFPAHGKESVRGKQGKKGPKVRAYVSMCVRLLHFLLLRTFKILCTHTHTHTHTHREASTATKTKTQTEHSTAQSSRVRPCTSSPGLPCSLRKRKPLLCYRTRAA
jgi:hypothetical protein